MSTPEPAGLPSSSRSDEDHLTDRYPAGQFLTTRETDVDPGPGAPLPREFGNYTLLEEIGAGGMGVVYKARQKSPDRLVALKMIRAGQLASAEDVRRFREEADRAAGLDHPHIVPVFDFGEVAGQHFFSMKLIGGGSLARHLVRYRDDPKEAARLLAAVARAVHHAHQRQLLHRDLKPQNLLLDDAGRPFVVDFGLSRRLDQSQVTASGILVGTPEYMPPEQAAAQKHLTTAVDVYALGAVLYAMLTGRPPFQGRNVLETLRQVAEREPTAPRLLNPLVPRDLEVICLKCLAKSPARRYGSAEALADDLERHLRGEPIAARPVRRPERVWAWCRRNPATAALTGSVALLLLLLSIGSTLAALWLKRGRDAALDAEDRAVSSEQGRLLQLYRAYLNDARSSRTTGQKVRGLAAIRDILKFLPPDALTVEQRDELRDEAIACLGFTDVEAVTRRAVPTRGIRGTDASPDCEELIHDGDDHNDTVVSRVSDGGVIFRFPRPEGAPPSSVEGRWFDPSGRWLAELRLAVRPGDLGRFRVWDRHLGRMALEESVQGSSPSFYPDGRRMLLGDSEGRLCEYDLISGTRRYSPARFSSMTFAVSPDGKQVAVASRDQPAQIIDLATWETVQTIPRAGARTAAVAWCAGGLGGNNGLLTLVLGNEEGNLFLWYPEQSTGYWLSGRHAGPVVHICFSPDGTYLASSAVDQKCIVRKVHGDVVLHPLSGRGVRFSRDSKRLAVVTPHDAAVYQLVPSKACVQHRVHAESAEFSPDGRWIAVAGRDGANFHEADTLYFVNHLMLDRCGPVCFHPGGRELLTFGVFTGAWRWPITGSESGSFEIGPPKRIPLEPDALGLVSRFLQLKPQHAGRSAAWSHDGKKLALADWRHDKVWLTGVDKSQPPRVLASMVKAARVAVSPEGQWVAGSSDALEIGAWILNASTGATALEVPGHTHVAFDAAGRWFASASNLEVHLYRAGTWRRQHQFSRDQLNHAMVALQPSGDLMAFSTQRGQVRLCECETGRTAANIHLPEAQDVTWLAFSPDGTRLAVVLDYFNLYVWDLHMLRAGLTELGLDFTDLPSRPDAAPPPRSRIQVVRGAELPRPEQWSKFWMRLALQEQLEGKYRDAIISANQALYALLPTAPPAERARIHTQRGRFYHQNGSPLAAREDWEAALALSPAQPEAARYLARLCLLGPPGCRNLERAYTLLVPLAERVAPADEDRLLLALAKVLLNRPKEGLPTLEKLAVAEWKPFVSYGLALARSQLGQSKEAKAALAEGVVAQERLLPTLDAVTREELDRLRREAEAQLRRN